MTTPPPRPPSDAPSGGAGTTLLRGGVVYSPVHPRASAMVVSGNMIAWVGGEEAADAKDASVDTVIDLDGALVTPGFVDAHVHATSTGLALLGLDLSRCPTLATALDRVAEYARAHPGRVVLGQGWDETAWPERRPPTRDELDRAAGGGRVYLPRVDGHSAVVSTALVAEAPGATVLPGFDVEGWLWGEAHHAVRRVAYGSITADQRRAAQRATRRRAAEMGIGCLHELGGPDLSSEDDFESMLALGETEPGPDVIGYWGELGAVAKARELGAYGAAGDLFADGAIGSRTAALHEPYADDGSTRGVLWHDEEALAHHVAGCARAGVQPGFHVIGDRAVDTVVAALERAIREVGRDALARCRPRLEHVEMASRQAITRMAALGVVASVQPAFDAAWGGPAGMYAVRLGAARAGGMNDFATMAATGVPLVFGSDTPVTPLDPWGTVRAAVYHRERRHRMSPRAAVAAHTRGGWRAVGRDSVGVLAPGAPATYAVWRCAELVSDRRVPGHPDGEVSARTPLLPDLSPGQPLPSCLRTVVRGVTVFDREHEGGSP